MKPRRRALLTASPSKNRVRAVFTRFETAPVQEFVPILAERELRRELERQAGVA